MEIVSLPCFHNRRLVSLEHKIEEDSTEATDLPKQTCAQAHLQ